MTIAPSRHAFLEVASSTLEDEVCDRYLALGTARGGKKKGDVICGQYPSFSRRSRAFLRITLNGARPGLFIASKSNIITIQGDRENLAEPTYQSIDMSGDAFWRRGIGGEAEQLREEKPIRTFNQPEDKFDIITNSYRVSLDLILAHKTDTKQSVCRSFLVGTSTYWPSRLYNSLSTDIHRKGTFNHRQVQAICIESQNRRYRAQMG